MTDYSADQVIWTSRVTDAFGPVVELQDDQGKVSYYNVEKEFDVAGASYAVLRSENGNEDDEPEIFKILTAADGSLELVTIDDDDEWENVSELYDELTFPE
ncbi:DUF1292 domain-containing protein [Paenibacillus sp. Marseille-P2973]|uniref:DUF1292 domain-containing protein n=1 Tax=Paenibacillus vini TaxID=1476024 RepID=A0ABQ4MHW6_9BACL|nr:DUF1292 domain-containing protein [Paenibacillus vini]MBQ4897824.1 DUF1292 domain-containing protein [Paenibacillus sp. Marseille-P2973]MDN4067197.1 DUF1292 domain-containing protein [Paenibacillus vini]GIP55567.1 hypothetical protein J42TS3_46020 [Paenibacillus vini]